MKLRLPSKLQAALIATLASAAFTTLSTGTTAQAWTAVTTKTIGEYVSTTESYTQHGWNYNASTGVITAPGGIWDNFNYELSVTKLAEGTANVGIVYVTSTAGNKWGLAAGKNSDTKTGLGGVWGTNAAWGAGSNFFKSQEDVAALDTDHDGLITMSAKINNNGTNIYSQEDLQGEAFMASTGLKDSVNAVTSLTIDKNYITKFRADYTSAEVTWEDGTVHHYDGVYEQKSGRSDAIKTDMGYKAYIVSSGAEVWFASGAGTVEIDGDLYVEGTYSDGYGALRLGSQSGGTLKMNGLMVLGADTVISADSENASIGTVEINGEIKGFGHKLTVVAKRGYNAPLTINGLVNLGAFDATSPVTFGASAVASLGNVNITNQAFTNNGQVTVTGGTINGYAGAGTLIKTGAGALNMGGTSSIGRTIQLQGGTLTLNGEIDVDTGIGLSNYDVYKEGTIEYTDGDNGGFINTNTTQYTLVKGTNTTVDGSYTFADAGVAKVDGADGLVFTYNPTTPAGAYYILASQSYDATKMDAATEFMVQGNNVEFTAAGSQLAGKALTLGTGTIWKTGSGGNFNSQQVQKLTLLGDAKVNPAANGGIIGASDGETFLDLQGHTLTIASSSNHFALFNTTALSSGTISIDDNRFLQIGHSQKTSSARLNDVVLNFGGANAHLTIDNNSTLTVEGLTGNGTIQRDGGSTPTLILAPTLENASYTFTGKFTTTAKLVMDKASTGTQAINVSTASTIDSIAVHGGTLSIGGTAALTVNNGVTVDGGTLALGNSLGGDITVKGGATLALATGSSRVTEGNLTMESGSHLALPGINGTRARSGSYTAATVGGAITLNGVTPTLGGAYSGTVSVSEDNHSLVVGDVTQSGSIYHLYILTGQSNSLGAVKDSPLSQGMLDAYQATGVKMYNANITSYNSKDNMRHAEDNPAWVQLAPQKPEYSGTYQGAAWRSLCMGPEYGFAYMMQKNGWFTSEGHENTDGLGIVLASLDGGGNQYWDKSSSTGYTYEDIVQSVKNALVAAKDGGYNAVSLDGLMYLQGESNSSSGATNAAPLYAAFLGNLRSDLETWMAEQNITGIDLVFSNNTVTGEPHLGNATRETTATNLYNAAVSSGMLNADMNGRGHVLTNDLAVTNCDNLSVHYTGDSQLTIGARYAYAFAVQNGINVGAVRGQDDSVTLDQDGAWWMEVLPGENEVATWDISSVSTVNNIAADATLKLGGIKIDEVYHNGATAKGQGSVAINGGNLSLGEHGIELTGADLTIGSALTARASQTWQTGAHALNIGGTATIEGGATVTVENSSAVDIATLAGEGNLAVNGGLVSVHALDAYTGDLTVTSGTLALEQALTIGNLSVGNVGTLKLGGSANLTTTGTFSLTAGSTLDLTGLNTVGVDKVTLVSTSGSGSITDLGDWSGVQLNLHPSVASDAHLELAEDGSSLYLTYTSSLTDALIWDNNAGDKKWLTSANWHKDGSSEHVAFTTGSNVHFTDTPANPSPSLDDNVTAGAMVVDSGVTVNLNAAAHTLTMTRTELGSGSSLVVTPGSQGNTITLGDLLVSGTATMTTAQGSHNPRFIINNLWGDENSVLNLKTNSQMSVVNVYDMNGGDRSDFRGNITLHMDRNNNKANRMLAMNINAGAATQLKDSVLTLSVVDNYTQFYSALGLNTDASLRGITDNGYANANYIIFSGAATTNTSAAQLLALGDTPHTLTLDTAGGTYSTRAKVLKNISLVKKGEGTQTFTGDLSALDGTVTVNGGTLALSNSSSTQAELAGATVEAGGTLSLTNVNIGIGGTLELKEGGSLIVGSDIAIDTINNHSTTLNVSQNLSAITFHNYGTATMGGSGKKFTATNLILEEGSQLHLNINTSGERAKITTITGRGDIDITSGNGGRTYDLVGDLSDWTGSLAQTTGSGWMTLNITGTEQLNADIINNATTNADCRIVLNLKHDMAVNGRIIYTDKGPIDMTVGATDTPAAITFNNEVKVRTLTVAAGSSASFGGTTTIGSMTVAANGSATVGAGSDVTYTGSSAIANSGTITFNGDITANNLAVTTNQNVYAALDGTLYADNSVGNYFVGTGADVITLATGSGSVVANGHHLTRNNVEYDIYASGLAARFGEGGGVDKSTFYLHKEGSTVNISEIAAVAGLVFSVDVQGATLNFDQAAVTFVTADNAELRIQDPEDAMAYNIVGGTNDLVLLGENLLNLPSIQFAQNDNQKVANLMRVDNGDYTVTDNSNPDYAMVRITSLEDDEVRNGRVTITAAAGTHGVYSVANEGFDVNATKMEKIANGRVQVDNTLAVRDIHNDADGKTGDFVLTKGVDAAALKNVIATSGNIEFQNMSATDQANLNTLEIGAGKTVSMYTGSVAEAAQEASVTVSGTLTADAGATLNANLEMEGGSHLSVAEGGLNMGSTVTLNQGMNLDSWTGGLELDQRYVLFTGVDGLDLGYGMHTGEIGKGDWMEAGLYFTNVTNTEEVTYLLYYGGASTPEAAAESGAVMSLQNNGSNVGMVYIYAVATPEPTTGTLSLLALCALAARRRRK